MMAVAVVVLLLLVLFLCGSAWDYWRRWRNEKLWSEHLLRLLAQTRAELAYEKKLRMAKEKSNYGASRN